MMQQQTPFELFDQWMDEAEKAGVVEPYTMVVSTVDDRQRPHSRVVFLRRIVEGAYYFFTNYNSDKSRQIAGNPAACLNFHWRQPVSRQVRIEGVFKKASAEISDEYYNGRPRGSQIGAWASPQSQPIANRQELEQKIKDFEKQFADRAVPRPEFWGGWGLTPTCFEFWQEGEYRLHTRRRFELDKNGWTETLLGP